MAEPSDPLRGLRTTLAQLAAADVPEIVAEARVSARARARALIEDTLVEELLRAAAAERPANASRAERAAAAGRPANASRTEPSADVPALDHPTDAPRAEHPAHAPSTPGPAPDGEACWAYCILAAGQRDAARGDIEGVEPGTKVELIQEGELLTLVSPVPLAEFSDERIREHLNDIEWVDRVARAHERVLEQVLERATILPLRLCTLYRDRAGVRRMLRDQESLLRETLVELEGRREWGIKVFADQNRLAASVHEQRSEPAAAGPSGAEYMARRQRERKSSERVHELGEAVAQEIHARAESVAERSRANPLQRPEVHGKKAQMLLNAAYLVSREREHELRDLAASLRDRWGERGFEVELTGPWPPYNFVSPSAMVTP